MIPIVMANLGSCSDASDASGLACEILERFYEGISGLSHMLIQGDNCPSLFLKVRWKVSNNSLAGQNVPNRIRTEYKLQSCRSGGAISPW